MGCTGTVGLSAGGRVAGGDSFWLRPGRPDDADGRLPRPDDADAGVHTQNWSLCYMRPQRPAHRDGRTQQAAR